MLIYDVKGHHDIGINISSSKEQFNDGNMTPFGSESKGVFCERSPKFGSLRHIQEQAVQPKVHMSFLYGGLMKSFWNGI
jgi:hypothetical protein